MELLVLAVGKARKGPEAKLFEQYFERTRWPVSLREVEERRPISGAQRQKREGELLLAHIPQRSFVFVLDTGGKEFSSEEFAGRLGRIGEDGGGPVTFIIGGADGHGQAVLARADALLSLGKMTWPHMLVRVMLAEQIYRAWSISAGHPYHLGH